MYVNTLENTILRLRLRDSTQVVTIIGNTINAPYINALNIQAKSVKSDWVYTGNISANQINAGTISASRISGGTLSGVILNVSTNATIGNEIQLGSLSSSETKAIKFYDAAAGASAISYLSGNLNLSSFGSVKIVGASGGLIANKLEVISSVATIGGSQIATLDDTARKSHSHSEYVTASTVQSMINAAISDHVVTFHF